MVRCHRVFAENLRQMPRDALGHASRVDEDQCRAVCLDQLGQALVDELPDIARHHRRQRHRRQFEREVALARVADVDDVAIRRAPFRPCRGTFPRSRRGRGKQRRRVLRSSSGGRRGRGWQSRRVLRSSSGRCSGRGRQRRRVLRSASGGCWERGQQRCRVLRPFPCAAGEGGGSRMGAPADEKFRDLADWLLRRRKADAREASSAQRLEALERQRQVRAALRRRERVDLVDDDRARRREHRASRFRAEQDVERLGRRHDDMRRTLAHRVALGLRRIARAHERADIDVGITLFLELRADALERGLQVDAHVVRQRLERRDVDDRGLVA